jgi:phenylalanyl-tRNA synthetase beta chain
MKISTHWLQEFFDETLPRPEALAEALTFHVFEIDGIEKVGDDDILDVKVTPNRGHDCLSHVGIAKEISAILNIPLTRHPLLSRATPLLATVSTAECDVSVTVADSNLCRRYIAGYIRGVTIGPSPAWLKERLEAIGQRSINNVVDATNYVMFHLGQPLHAFDASKLVQKVGGYAVEVRTAKKGEVLLALDGKEYTLDESMLVIADANKGEAIGIAGVKGGMPAGITSETRDIIIESANFEGASVRKTAQTLRLRTDASMRFEQQLSPELAVYGMHGVASLIVELAGGELVCLNDVYPTPQIPRSVSVSVSQVGTILGETFGEKEIVDSFTRLRFSHRQEGGMFAVDVPFERLDLEIPEDLVEEVGRIQGYDKVPTLPLPPFNKKPEINGNFYAAEKLREELVVQEYSEVFTSVFADAGERVVLNKVDGVRPFLRGSLLPGLQEVLKKNIPNKELLGLKEVKLFEIGTVWKGGKEMTMVGTISEKQKAEEKPLEISNATEYENLPLSQTEHYQSFSKYPYIVRDVSFWLPMGNSTTEYQSFITDVFSSAGEGLMKVSSRNVDEYEKEGRKSVAFRLIFQSFERTLTDEEVNAAMEKVYAALKGKSFEIR